MAGMARGIFMCDDATDFGKQLVIITDLRFKNSGSTADPSAAVSRSDASRGTKHRPMLIDC